jgi:AraC-like DNA-binding protein
MKEPPFQSTINSPYFLPMETFPFYIGIRLRDEIKQQIFAHDGFEIGALIRGEGTYVLNNRRYQYRAGDCCFFDSTLPHLLIPSDDGEFMSLFIEIREQAVHALFPFFQNVALMKPFLLTAQGVSPIIPGDKGLFESISSIYRIAYSGDPFARSKAWQMTLGAIIKIAERFSNEEHLETTASGNTSSRMGVVEKAIVFIDEHFRESISLDDIATHCRVSSSFLSHSFARIVQSSPIRYRNELRIKWSYKKIIENRESVDSICLDAGFSSYSQFSKLFKELTHVTPQFLRQSKIE